MNALTAVGGNLRVSDCGGLTAITGLSNVASVGGDLLIARNPDLTTIAGLAPSSARRLIVIDNVVLPCAEATTLQGAMTLGGIGSGCPGGTPCDTGLVVRNNGC
jgi:hypothetical protein